MLVPNASTERARGDDCDSGFEPLITTGKNKQNKKQRDYPVRAIHGGSVSDSCNLFVAFIYPPLAERGVDRLVLICPF